MFLFFVRNFFLSDIPGEMGGEKWGGGVPSVFFVFLGFFGFFFFVFFFCFGAGGNVFGK